VSKVKHLSYCVVQINPAAIIMNSKFCIGQRNMNGW